MGDAVDDISGVDMAILAGHMTRNPVVTKVTVADKTRC